MASGFCLSDDAREVMIPLPPKNQPGARQVDGRRAFGGFILALPVECRWQDCPLDHGPSTTVCNRFNRRTHKCPIALPDCRSHELAAAHGDDHDRAFRASFAR